MSNYNSNLQTNNTNLQSILDTINALPEAGTDLPELTNPANASEVFLGKEVINQDGDTVTGTFTIDNEVNTQEDLLAELQTALAGKTGGSGNTNIETCTVNIAGCQKVGYTGIENQKLSAKYSSGTSSYAEHELVVCKNSAVFCVNTVGGNANTNNASMIMRQAFGIGDHVFIFNITENNASISFTNMGGSTE
jgi:hypothetical protein